MRTKAPIGSFGVNTCDNKYSWSGLSPFVIGDCTIVIADVADLLPKVTHTAKIFENAWQYTKVYKKMTDEEGNPTPDYWTWALKGWASDVPHRYPMGRGAKPEYCWWNGEKLGYIEARKKIYAPLYIKAVMGGTFILGGNDSFKRLRELYREGDDITLRDYDGYDHEALGMSLTDVLNNPDRKMGHSFILKMLLTEDEALKQIVM